MSTSDRGGGGDPTQPLPSVEQLNQWANEFFKALPGGGTGATQSASPLAMPSMGSTMPNPNSAVMPFVGPAAAAPYATPSSPLPYGNYSSPAGQMPWADPTAALPYAPQSNAAAMPNAAGAPMPSTTSPMPYMDGTGHLPANMQPIAAPYPSPSAAAPNAYGLPLSPALPAATAVPPTDPMGAYPFPVEANALPYMDPTGAVGMALLPAGATSPMPGPIQAGTMPYMGPAATGLPFTQQNNATPSAVAPFGAFIPNAAMPRESNLDALINSLAGATGTSATQRGAPGPSASSYYFLDDAIGAAAHAPAPKTAPAATQAPVSSAPRYEAGDVRAWGVPDLKTVTRQYDPRGLRRDFPILNELVNGRRLVWLDNAATTQKPQVVIDRLKHFYEHENSNIHRAAHTLAARATDAYEAAREKSRRFLNASSVREIIFVRGATEGVNLVAQSWGRRYIEKGDEIVISWVEHHSNIVPWQMLCAEKGARLRVAPVDDTGQVILEEYEKLLNPRTRLVSITHVSNALGTVLPVREMTAMAHRHGAKVLVDGAQAVSHMRVDVQTIDADFYVFSGHKVFGPTGIGVVFGKADVLEATPPWHGGGNMIADVTFEKTVYHGPPMRMEAGTGNIADAVGLGAALDYVEQVGMENIARHEHELLVYGTEQLRTIPGLRLIGTAREKAGVMGFIIDGFRPEDIGAALAADGIAVRAGHHCAQPALRRFGQEATVRPSLALYNTQDDIDAMMAVLRKLQSAGRSQGR